jgi:L-ascorbate metabolism protein UlaG (beta-lactamase superfamily)
MQIKYIGHASFFIKTKQARVVTDPYDPKAVGLKFPKIEADIVMISHSHPDHNKPSGVSGNPLVIAWPGEYEKKGVRISGFKSYHDKQQGAQRGENILYKLEAENISLLHCGDMGVIPGQELLDEIGDIDILMIPVGGFYTIDPDEAAEVVKKIEPSLVIPMHYNDPAVLNQKTFGKLATLGEFMKKFGVEKPELVDQLVIRKEELGEEMKIVPMKRTA